MAKKKKPSGRTVASGQKPAQPKRGGSRPPLPPKVSPPGGTRLSRWRRHLDQLREFKKAHGHCAVPRGTPWIARHVGALGCAIGGAAANCRRNGSVNSTPSDSSGSAAEGMCPPWPGGGASSSSSSSARSMAIASSRTRMPPTVPSAGGHVTCGTGGVTAGSRRRGSASSTPWASPGS